MRRRYRRGRPGSKFVLLLMLVSMITLGYSVLASTLIVDGTAKVGKTTWDVHYENVVVATGSVQATPPEILDDTVLKYVVELNEPGDYYEFTFDVVNSGTIDAVVDKVVETELTDAQSKYLSYSLSYLDGTPIKIGDELKKKNTKTLKVRLEMKTEVDESDLPTEEEEIKMRLETEYVQLGKTSANDWDEDGVLKILSVGNSFSIDTLHYVYQVANDLGVENIELGILYYSGCNLDKHVEFVQSDSAAYDYYFTNNGSWTTTPGQKASDVVASNNWDYIMLQQQSNLASNPSSYDSLNVLLPIIKSYVNKDSNPKYIWNLTWATRDVTDQVLEYKAIAAAVQSKIEPNEEISMIIPTGTAIQNARTIYGNTLNRDVLHLSITDGRYIAAVNFVKSLLGLDINNLHYVVSGEKENLLASAIASANAAYEKPYEIANLGPYYEDESEKVNSMYTDCPVARDGYKCLNLEYASGFWNSSTGNTTKLTSGVKYMSSQIVEKKYIPNGSIIKITSGWNYRPEGWQALSTVNPTRPTMVSYVGATNGEKIVDDTWHSDFNYRAFVLSKGSNDISGYTQDELKEVLQVYVPESEIEKIS